MSPSNVSVHRVPTSSTNQPSQVDATRNQPTVLESHGYHLGKTIGTGSYATVRLGQSDRHGGNVAIKIVSKYSAPQDYLKKFLPREIEVVKGLRHPNLIRFLQAIETTHRVYIIMEYAENGSLLDIIRKEQYIDEPRARKWFRQLVDAVDYCHDKGVVHRDIKCENMLMGLNFVVKLSDFGFAKGQLRLRNGNVPNSDTFCGSYAYACPEILRGIPYQPHYADIWSMGVVLFAMVYGRLPFDDSNYKELIKQVSSKVIFPAEPKITYNCKSLINKILAPVKSRIRISGIRNDTWFTYNDEQEERSKRYSSVSDSDEERKLSIDSDEITVPKLITKRGLKAEAKPREREHRASTDEETPIKLESPDPQSSDNEDDLNKKGKKQEKKQK